jgi:hypothetical protein
MIFFPGDKITATVNGDQRITGVIKEFDYDVRAIILGVPQEVAVVEVTEADSADVIGAWLLVPVAELEAVA